MQIKNKLENTKTNTPPCKIIQYNEKLNQAYNIVCNNL